MSLSEKEIKALEKNEFELDCPSISLRNKSAGETFRGSGSIRRSPDGWLLLRMYARNASKRNFPFERSGKSGELIAEREYYSLSALDSHGRSWKCDRMLPRTDQVSSPESRILITGQVPELRSSSAWVRCRSILALSDRGVAPRRSYMKMLFFHELRYPANTRTRSTVRVAGRVRSESINDAAKFRAAGYSFLLTKDGNSTCLEIAGNDVPFTKYFEVRVVEALQFIFGRPMPWTVFEVHSKKGSELRIRATPKPYATIPQPPLAHNDDAAGDSYRLFGRYLRFVAQSQTADWHRMSRTYYSVIEAASGSIGAQALSTAVAAEGLARILLPHESTGTRERKEVKSAIRLIMDSRLSEDVKRRIASAISMLNNPNAKTLFRKLLRRNWIQPAHVDAWDKLRHPWAHAVQPESFEFQNLIDMVDSVLVLCHQLIFRAIRYKGKYTDYSEKGWPTRTYPVRASPSTKQQPQKPASV
jgi:hypothetical protein